MQTDSMDDIIRSALTSFAREALAGDWRGRREYEPYVEWLQAFTKAYPEVVGYAITANRPGGGFLLDCVRVAEGVAGRE